MASAPNSLTNFSQAATPATNAPSNIPGGPGIQEMTLEERETPQKDWDDGLASKIALNDFQRMESYRTINHDYRFRESDRLYVAWKERKTWEGTKIPRSSLGIFIGLEQIEALLPSVVLSLFPDNNRLPFEAEPTPGTTVEQAKAVRDLESWQLGDVGEPGHFLSMRELTRRGYKSSYIYGHSPVEFGMYDCTVPRTTYQRIDIPIRTQIPHPITGVPVAVPTGQYRSSVRSYTEQKRIVKPVLANTDVRDFYWDPNCSSHNINDGACCATRHLMSVNKLLEYAGTPGFKIPSPRDLLHLAQIKTMTQGDNSKLNQEAMLGRTYQPTIDYSVDPAQARVEVIRYWQKGHHVWLLGRQWVAYNQPNPYGMLPFLNAFYVDVPGRFAGLSICDLVEGDQKLAEAIINARIDELNLLIHPPIIKKQGRSFSASQQRLRPGVIWESENPKEDYIRFEMGNITQEAYVEVDALERRVQKKTGVTDLAVLGTPSSGGNSANRTATGISSQAGASGKRIQYHVENAEDQFIVPALNIIHQLNKIYLPMDQIIQVLGPDAQFIDIDPVDILNADVRFKMNASSKMRVRQMLQGGGLAIILQSILNPGLMELNMQMGYMLDPKQIDQLICDTFYLAPMSFWKQANPQQMQQFMMMRMAPEMMKRQQQADRLQSHERTAEQKDETTLINTLISKLITPQAAHSALDELTGSDLGRLDEPPEPAGNGNAND